MTGNKFKVSSPQVLGQLMEEICKLVPDDSLDELKLLLGEEENLNSEIEEQMLSKLQSKSVNLKTLEMTNLSKSKCFSNNQRFFNIAIGYIEASSKLGTLKIY